MVSIQILLQHTQFIPVYLKFAAQEAISAMRSGESGNHYLLTPPCALTRFH